MTTIVDPTNARLIAYLGGRGGEFLAHLLNSHAECVHSTMLIWAKNRHLMRFDDAIEFNVTHDPRQVFVISHYLVHDQIPSDNFIYAYNSPRYHPYYFLLFSLKTLMQRFYFNHRGWPHIVTEQQHQELAQELARRIPGRDWYYYHEAEAWLENTPADDIRTHIVKYLKKFGMGSYKERNQVRCSIIDLDQLYFGDTQAEYTRICDTWKLTPLPGAVDGIKEYHAKNMALIDQYLNCKADALFDAYLPIAQELILDACDRRHLDPHD